MLKLLLGCGCFFTASCKMASRLWKHGKRLKSYVPHTIKRLGISNVTLEQLEVLYKVMRSQADYQCKTRFYPDTDS